MSEKEKVIKSKFRVGQKVWSIARGYMYCEVVKVISVDKWGDILVGFEPLQRNGDKYELDNDEIFAEENLYASKEALLKALKSEEIE